MEEIKSISIWLWFMNKRQGKYTWKVWNGWFRVWTFMTGVASRIRHKLLPLALSVLQDLVLTKLFQQCLQLLNSCLLIYTENKSSTVHSHILSRCSILLSYPCTQPEISSFVFAQTAYAICCFLSILRISTLFFSSSIVHSRSPSQKYTLSSLYFLSFFLQHL